MFPNCIMFEIVYFLLLSKNVILAGYNSWVILLSKLFCWFFHIFYIDNHVSCEPSQFYVFFPNLYSFYFLFLPIALERTSSMMLKRKGERRHPCLESGLREKAESFSPFSKVSAIDFFSQIIFTKLRNSPLLLVC